jgi:hypothetical protein
LAKIVFFLISHGKRALGFVGRKNLQIICGNFLALANPTPL